MAERKEVSIQWLFLVQFISWLSNYYRNISLNYIMNHEVKQTADNN